MIPSLAASFPHRRSALLLACFLAPLAVRGEPGIGPGLEARWKALGAMAEPLERNQNTAVALAELAKGFPKDAQQEFQSHAGDERPAHKIVLSDGIPELKR